MGRNANAGQRLRGHRHRRRFILLLGADLKAGRIMASHLIRIGFAWAGFVRIRHNRLGAPT